VLAFALVSVLLRTCRPLAIAGEVSLFVVNAVNAAVGGPFAHIREKVFKFTPASANFNAAPAIVFVFWDIRIVAALYHAVPRAICERVRVIAGMLVSWAAPLASARPAVVASQAAASNYSFGAAIALAEPNGVSQFIPARIFKRDQTTKALTRDIDAWGHDDLLERLLCLKQRPGPPQARPLRHTSTIRAAALKAQQPQGPVL
jgi:hypothetical protein